MSDFITSTTTFLKYRVGDFPWYVLSHRSITTIFRTIRVGLEYFGIMWLIRPWDLLIEFSEAQHYWKRTDTSHASPHLTTNHEPLIMKKFTRNSAYHALPIVDSVYRLINCGSYFKLPQALKFLLRWRSVTLSSRLRIFSWWKERYSHRYFRSQVCECAMYSI